MQLICWPIKPSGSGSKALGAETFPPALEVSVPVHLQPQMEAVCDSVALVP